MLWNSLFIVFLLSVPAASFFCPSSKSLSRRKLRETRLFESLGSVRFLGRGKDAIVRPGVVLLSPPEEFQHFLRQAAVFLYAMGEDDDGVFVIRGAILDDPTPFTMGEMAEQDGDVHEVFQNLIFRGGEFGSDAAYMLHSDETLGEMTENEMIGTSGIFEGGLEYAIANKKSMDPEKINYFSIIWRSPKTNSRVC